MSYADSLYFSQSRNFSSILEQSVAEGVSVFKIPVVTEVVNWRAPGDESEVGLGGGAGSQKPEQEYSPKERHKSGLQSCLLLLILSLCAWGLRTHGNDWLLCMRCRSVVAA